jgi:hypothetical protein
MEPTLGWVLLSKEALKRAEDHLRDGEQGVRDEIGFLSIHQAYADRFFPGTSVLQTRLRYVLFVPWIYNDAVRNTGHQSINRFIQDQEQKLTKRLRDNYKDDGSNSDGFGIIGRRAYPKPTAQPPSMIYWTALRTWGILRPLSDGSFPSRRTVHRILDHNRSMGNRLALQDDDKNPLEESQHLFVSLPESPKEWKNAKSPINFDLIKEEMKFLQQRLSGVDRPYEAGIPSLLARLAEKNVMVAEIDYPWHRIIQQYADAEDKTALKRAGQASALAAIGRAIYAALVEQICEKEDQRPVSTEHRDWLVQTIVKYRETALKLDTQALLHDISHIASTSILEVLQETQRCLAKQSKIFDLRELYQQVEMARKGNRARLSRTRAAKERRVEWNTDKNPHPFAAPLHYRWPNVRRLLGDLRGGL